jgi:SAM-dependent methyltransferase
MDPSREQILASLRPYAERARRLQGWELEVTPVPLGPPLPWDYATRARELLAGAQAVLDLGTGGGERFAEILGSSAAPARRAVATEAWEVNAPVAAARLAPAGARVVQASSLRLPFADESFDLVLSRHEELAPAEVARLLRPGGSVLTQQCHPDDWSELRRFFPRMADFGPHDRLYREGLQAAGLTLIQAREHAQAVAYQSLGDIVYLLTAAPWMIPDFDVERDLEALLAVEAELGGPPGIVLTEGRYLLEARRPEDG